MKIVEDEMRRPAPEEHDVVLIPWRQGDLS
eukprot:COSAG05_NODE_7085_length_857_cov_2.013193_1_plen_29_part_10